MNGFGSAHITGLVFGAGFPSVTNTIRLYYDDDEFGALQYNSFSTAVTAARSQLEFNKTVTTAGPSQE